MAITDLEALYPGQADTPSAAYPQGAPRDESTPGANDGTPVKQNWIRDLWGAFSAVIAAGSITPSGSVETATASDFLLGLLAYIKANSTNTGVSTSVWTGSSTSLDLDSISGGHPGEGFYLLSSGGSEFMFYARPGISTQNVCDAGNGGGVLSVVEARVSSSNVLTYVVVEASSTLNLTFTAIRKIG